MDKITYNNTSIRGRSLIDTLDIAKKYANKLGISRVTNITHLDYFGIPVFASISPKSQSICVNAGKGITVEEAKVGAYMEAIEFAYAEFNHANFTIHTVKVCEILDSPKRPDAILDFCPPFEKKINIDDSIFAIKAKDIFSQREYYIPAEVVFFPTPTPVTNQIFGSNTNGLASGNSILEARIHGLCEVIERDIQSFQRVLDTSFLLDINSLPDDLVILVNNIRKSGVHIWIRYVKNEYGIPHYYTCLYDKSLQSLNYVNIGYGCHPISRIALLRSVTEAVQSRLSYIHGGRTDLIDYENKINNLSESEKQNLCTKIVSNASNPTKTIDFSSVDNVFEQESTMSLDEIWEKLLECIKEKHFKFLFCVEFTKPDDELHVVKVILPGAENFSLDNMRVGKRLKQVISSQLS